MASLAVVCPGYPDRPGGVTDHTRRLVEHWREIGHSVTVVGMRRPPVTTARRLVEDRVEALLIQYVPFLYGRRGISRFPGRLARAARARGMRVTTFVHEPWVPPTRLPWLVLSPWQRWQLRRLARTSDAVATAVPAWQRQVAPGTHLVYVGSTLGEPDDPAPNTTPLGGPVVFSPFASGLRWDWIAAAADALEADPPLIVVGGDRATARATPRVAPWIGEGWQWLPRQPAAEVLGYLQRARVVLAPFEDGATGRRTSLLAALSTGARVITSTGPLFDPVFDVDHVTTAHDKAAFVLGAQQEWTRPLDPTEGSSRRAWFATQFAPDRLDDTLLALVRNRRE